MKKKKTPLPDLAVLSAEIDRLGLERRKLITALWNARRRHENPEPHARRLKENGAVMWKLLHEHKSELARRFYLLARKAPIMRRELDLLPYKTKKAKERHP